MPTIKMERKKGKNVKKYHSRGSEFDALEAKQSERTIFCSPPGIKKRYWEQGQIFLINQLFYPFFYVFQPCLQAILEIIYLKRGPLSVPPLGLQGGAMSPEPPPLESAPDFGTRYFHEIMSF